MKRIRLFILALFATGMLAGLGAQAQTTYRWVDKDGKVWYSDQPPPPDAKNIQKKQLGSGNYVDTSTPSYSAQKAAQDFPVTLFTSADCGSECKIAREFLTRRGISFSEKLIRTVSDSVTFKKATGIDELIVPTLLVGSQAQKGYEEAAWSKLLEAAGYPLDAPAPPGNKVGPDNSAKPPSPPSPPR